MGSVAEAISWWDKPPASAEEFSTSNPLVEVMEAARDLVGQIAKPYALINVGSWQTTQSLQALAIDVPEQAYVFAATNRSAVSVVNVATEFASLASNWQSETYHLSGGDIELHPAYLGIIGIGPDAVPLILRELRDRGGHWFWALEAITKTNPAEGSTSVSTARDAWLRWGEARGLI